MKGKCLTWPPEHRVVRRGDLGLVVGGGVVIHSSADPDGGRTSSSAKSFHPTLDFQPSFPRNLVVSPRGIVGHGVDGSKDRPAYVLSKTLEADYHTHYSAGT